jgi:hypothetical protein
VGVAIRDQRRRKWTMGMGVSGKEMEGKKKQKVQGLNPSEISPLSLGVRVCE